MHGGGTACGARRARAVAEQALDGRRLRGRRVPRREGAALTPRGPLALLSRAAPLARPRRQKYRAQLLQPAVFACGRPLGSVLGSWAKTMRESGRSKERWEKAPYAYPRS